MKKEILVLYYSQGGSVEKLANLIARGVNMVDGVSARIRTVPKVTTVTKAIEPQIPENGVPYVSFQDLDECIGLLLGSPARFANMAAPMKYFLDGTGDNWLRGSIIGKPAGVFTSSASMHGGQETCLISMMTGLMHHGAVIVGIPYSQSDLSSTKSGGTPYGVTHVAGSEDKFEFSEEEKNLAIYQGRHLAEIALKLSK